MTTTDKAKLSNAAQKAWATRRAKAAGAAMLMATTAPIAAVAIPSSGPLPGQHVERKLEAWQLPKPVIVEAPEAREEITQFEMVTLWVDEPDVGCGFHRFVVVERSDRLVRLFHPSRLTTINVARKYFDKHGKAAERCRRSVVAEIIRRNIAMADAICDRKQDDKAMFNGGAWGEFALRLATEGRLA